jgi:hypothetical protein
MLDTEDGHGNSVINQRNPVELIGLVRIVSMRLMAVYRRVGNKSKYKKKRVFSTTDDDDWRSVSLVGSVATYKAEGPGFESR